MSLVNTFIARQADRERPESAKDHGMLFRGAMIRMLLRGLKTETRRPIAWSNSLVNGEGFPKRLWVGLDFDRAWVDPGPSPAGNEGPYLKVPFQHPDDSTDGGLVYRVYPRIWQGDRIWAKETFRYGDALEGEPAEGQGVHYRADEDECAGGPWRSSIVMPRWASRIMLDVTEPTLPQPIGELTPEQVTAEGFPLPASDPEGEASFHEYWRRLHGSFDPSLWTWAYRGLRMVDTNATPELASTLRDGS